MLVNTVLGSVDSTKIGRTLMHEHILIANHTLRKAYKCWFDEDMFFKYAVTMLKNAKMYGIDTIVDATPIDLGRDLDIMRKVSEKSGVNIIAATGFYWPLQISLSDKSPEFIADIMINDLENGMEGTEVKAQFIKYSTVNPDLTDYDKKIGEAVAIAHKRTGAMIYTHTGNKNGMSQIEFFRANGVDLSKLIVGHMGDTEDYEYIHSVLAAGCRIGLDRFGAHNLEPEYYIEDERKAKVIANLISQGYIDKMVISHDVACYLDYSGYQNVGNLFQGVMERDLNKFLFQFNYIPKYVYNMFKECGITESEIDHIMVKNPQRIFEGK